MDAVSVTVIMPAKSHFLEAVTDQLPGSDRLCRHRYAKLAEQMASQCTSDPVRKQELLRYRSRTAAEYRQRVRQNFYEACQSFWFVQQLLTDGIQWTFYFTGTL
ncbi:MAG: pyruvate formate lyase family protein [Dorea sp.]